MLTIREPLNFLRLESKIIPLKRTFRENERVIPLVVPDSTRKRKRRLVKNVFGGNFYRFESQIVRRS